MTHFFSFGQNLPADAPSMDLFTWPHFLILSALLLLGILVAKTYKACAKRSIYRKVVAVSTLVSILPLQAALLITGDYAPWNLPLHLCHLGIAVILVDAFYENKATKEISFVLTLPGAFLALIFPDWANHPLFNLLLIQSFAFHALLVYYISMRFAAGEILPKLRHIWMPLLFLAALLPIIFFLNLKLGTNFFFLNRAAPGSPMVLIQEAFGLFYIPALFGVVLLLMLAIYGLLGALKSRDSN